MAIAMIDPENLFGLPRLPIAAVIVERSEMVHLRNKYSTYVKSGYVIES